tara:strand:- start:102 stop:374 length:273 start_codon:yes stop_codon:yes gene_type:complete
MKEHIPDSIREYAFTCFSLLSESERAVILMGEEAYRASLDLENDDAPCWVVDSGDTHGFVGWNPQCIPTIEYIKWKLDRHSKIVSGEIKG